MKTSFKLIPTASHFVVLLCTLFLLIFQSSVVAQTYTFTTLDDPLGVGGTIAMGVSGSNIVGYYGPAGGGYQGFLYNGSTYTTIADPLAAVNRTQAIGISGNNIVGLYNDPLGHEHGFLYNGSTYTTLDAPLGVNGTNAFGLSGNNIVGYYFATSGNPNGFLYNGSTYITLDDSLGVNGTCTNAISGNNIVGGYFDAFGSVHGFLYNGSSYTTLDDPSGVNYTSANGICGNNIVGTYTDGANKGHGFLYNGSTYTTIDDPLGVNYTNINGISGNSIVGTYGDALGNGHGFLATVTSASSTWSVDASGNWSSSSNWGTFVPTGIDAQASFSRSITAPRTVTLDMAVTVGTLIFNNANKYTISGSQTLTLQASSGDAAIQVINGTHELAAPLVLASNTDVTVSNAADTLIISGAISGTGTGLNKFGSGTLTLSGGSNYTGGTTLSQGTLNVTGTMAGGGNIQVNAGASLSGSGLIQGSITGQAGSSIIATGNLVLGDSTSFTGFNHAGTLTVGNNAVTLNSLGFANLGVLTTLAGGSINAPNGISLGTGCNLSGSGTVNGAVSAGYGSVIYATGNLTLGDSTAYDGFTSNGRLYTNANTVTLNSADAANNKNAVVLGSLTQLDGGSLVAPNGMLLNPGNNLVATNNGGTVSGGTASRFLNLGNVQGPSSSSGNWLTFNMLFKGGTGQTSGQIDFAGGFATGDSPGVNTQYGNAEIGGTETEFDIGGTSPGNSANNYGQLNIVANPSDLNAHGDLILSPQTDLKIVDWNGFVPTPGETFTVLTWEGTLSGTASLSIDPAFAAEGIQFVPEWKSNSLAIEAVPEPGTLILLAVCGIGGLGWAWRRRRVARRMAESADPPASLLFPSHPMQQTNLAQRPA